MLPGSVMFTRALQPMKTSARISRRYNVGMAPLFQALEDLQSSIGDTVVFPEPRLLPLHAMCSYCWKVVNGAQLAVV